MYIYYFRSNSGDEFFMKSEKMEYDLSEAERFCAEKIPEEYECWEGKSFKYAAFKITQVNPILGYARIDRLWGEWYKIIPEDMVEADVALFTDYYQPDTYSQYNEKL